MGPLYFGSIPGKRKIQEYHISDCYIYTRAFNECLHNHPEASTREALEQCQVEFAFTLDHFFFCLTGLKKNIYHAVYGHEASDYLEIYDGIRRELMRMVEENGYAADIFIVMGEDTKQIAILFSPGQMARCTPAELARRMGSLVQQSCEQNIFKGDNRYCNVTALSPALSGFGQIREGYRETRRLCDLAFFRMEQTVFTEEKLCAWRSGAEYRVVMDGCGQLCMAVDEGDAEQALRCLDTLFLDLLRNSYSLSLCRDVLSYCKNMLQIRCTVHDLMDGVDLEHLCNVENYLRIEECVAALTPVLTRLCAAVRLKGIYSKAVLVAIYYIKNHYSEDIFLPDIARYVNINANYLSSSFRENTGIALRDYITGIRISEGKKLLRGGKRKVTEIAQAVGFCDAKYFTRTFKRLVGVGPVEYRNSSDE